MDTADNDENKTVRLLITYTYKRKRILWGKYYPT